MGDIMPLDQIPEEDGVKIFLVGLYTQVTTEAEHLGKTSIYITG